MTALSGSEIQAALSTGEMSVEPLSPEGIQPASLDLRLGRRYLRLKEGVTLDSHQDNSQYFDPYFISDFLELPPGVLILGETVECVTLTNTLVAHLSGRSSIGRLGVLIHITAGLVDPGWNGILTLELLNVTQGPVRLYVGDRVAQLSIHRLVSSVDSTAMPYTGKYQNASEPQSSLIHYDGRSVHDQWAQLSAFRR